MGVHLPLAGQLRVSAIGSPKETTLASTAREDSLEESDSVVLAPPELELVQKLGGPELLSITELYEEARQAVLD